MRDGTVVARDGVRPSADEQRAEHDPHRHGDQAGDQTILQAEKEIGRADVGQAREGDYLPNAAIILWYNRESKQRER